MKITYQIDPAHTSIGFAGKHMMETTVRGRFKEYEGQVVTEDDDPTTAAIHLTIRVASLDTGVDRRDEHLRSADFFDVEKFPAASFRSSKVEDLGGDRYRVIGDLTVHGVTHPVVLSANSVQTKKKPPDLPTTNPLEWTMIIPTPISPPNSMMTYPQTRSESIRVPYSHSAKTRTGIG